MHWNDFILQIAICAVGIGIAIIIYKFDRRHAADQKKINKLAEQVEAYWILEKVYSSHILKNADKDGQDIKNIVKNYRDQAVKHPYNIDNIRPSMTAKQAQEYKE